MKNVIYQQVTLFVFLLFLCPDLSGQAVSINTDASLPHPSAILDVKSTDKGILVPRVTSVQRTGIASPAVGLLVFDTDTESFWYRDSSSWKNLLSPASGWSVSGNNAGPNDFMGTTNNQSLVFKTNNQQSGKIDLIGNNTFWGYRSGEIVTSAFHNTGIGWYSIQNPLSGSYNTAIGSGTLTSSFADFNTATGYNALHENTIGYNNTAIGAWALSGNSSGVSNTATGVSALRNNIEGVYNTANGNDALRKNVTGNANTAAGNGALLSNLSGSYNTATGYQALVENLEGGNNTAIGSFALYYNDHGASNTGIGQSSLYNNSSGEFNTGVGVESLNGNTIGSSNTAIGYLAGNGLPEIEFENCNFIGAWSSSFVNRTNVTMLGYGLFGGENTNDNQVCLGNSAVTQIRAAVTGITAYSDSRYKTNVEENVSGLDFILKLKPVTYNVLPKELHHIWGTPDSLANKIDHTETEQIRFIGFLAQDVEKAAQESGFNFPGIDIPRNSHEVYTLRYTDFIMPMVKAMQEMHTKTIQLQSEVKSQQLLVDVLVQQNEDLLQQLNLVKTEHQQQITELKTLLLELRAEITSSKSVEK